MKFDALEELTSKPLIPKWIVWLVFLVVVIALVGAVLAYGNQQYERGHALGNKETTALWISRENTELIQANAEIIRLQKQKRNEEVAHQNRLADLDHGYQEKRANEKAKSDVVISNLERGIAKLQFNARKATATTIQTAGVSTGPIESGTGSSHEETTCELPPEIGAALYAEADRSDGVAEQLAACQQIVIEDRRVCGGKVITP